MELINNILGLLSKNQNNPVAWIIAIVLLCIAIKVVNKIAKLISSATFLIIMFVKLFGVNTFLAFFR